MAIPLWEMKNSKSPVIILKGGDRQLTFYKAKKFGSKYFAIKDPNGGGMVFELDDRYEYRYKNTSVYIYNFSNFKPISLTGLAEIDKRLRTEGKSQLDNIAALLATLTDEQVRQFSDKIKDPKSGFSPETRRFLEDYSTDDENAKTEMLVSLHHQKNPITVYSSPMSGIGMNSGHYAVIQIGHKKLDIVEMSLYKNRAYTPYGVFNFTVDNLYLVKKQIMGFFILNDTEDSISEPVPKPVTKTIKMMAKKHQWSFLETFNKPKRTRMQQPAFGYQVKIEKVEHENDELIKAKINASLRPKPLKSEQPNKKSENMNDYDEIDNGDIGAKILERVALSAPQPIQLPPQPIQLPPQYEEPQYEPEEYEEQIIEDDTEEPIVEEEPYEREINVTQDITEPTPVEYLTEPSFELDISEATGPPGAR